MRNIIVVVLLVGLLLPVLARGAAGNKPSDCDRRKAEYIFLEAQRMKSKGAPDAFFDLLTHAHELDPTNTAVSFYMGYCLLSMRNTTPEQASQALSLMKTHFEEAPTDLYETTFYSDANMMVGRPAEALRALKKLSETNPNKLELQVRVAEAYARTGDYKQSNATYDTIEALHGKSMAVTNKKISNFVALNDSAGAIAEMRSLLATAPRNASYNISMGGVLQHFGLNDSALAYLDRAQQYEPDNGYTYLAKAQYYNLMGDSVLYDDQIYRALISENLDVDAKVGVLSDYTRQLLQSGDTTQRVTHLFEVLIDQHPHEAHIHDLYSEYLVVREKYAAAAEQLGYVLDINPTDAAGWRKLMLVNIMGENFAAALAAADRALAYNPDSLDLYRYIAPVCYQMKEYDRALKIYDHALAMIDSTDVELESDFLGGKADVYFSMGDTLKAFETYEKALELYPGNFGVMNNYAYFLALSERDLDKAERMSAITVKAYPTSATYLDTYAWVFFKKKNYSMALMYIRSAIDNDDTHSADVLEHYGDILFVSGEPDEAQKQWQKALELDPENARLQQKVKTGKLNENEQ
ncbi:MAG: tetratricopeptide repeat protein [Muribaculaceae bacterium]|nr:tetratricopeptide repeat protein [Muribaculaceae bacterium]HAP50133.1 hypothetical protein [Porphyromonadaceae bacterium]